MTATMNLIIHITSANPEILRDKLRENDNFKNYYDGWECTVCKTTQRVFSTRYYYYDIPHDILGEMIRHLQINKEGHTVRTRITQDGNHKFD